MDQQHPLYAADRNTVDRLLAAPRPEAQDIVDCARLITRYDSFQGAPDIKADLKHCLRSWDLTRAELNTSARTIWQAGFRPSAAEETEVGSGADVNAA